MSRIRKEQRQADRNQPFWFYVPVGETKQGIILDDAPDFFLYMHTMRDPVTGKWGKHVVCPKEYDHCPICTSQGESDYIMFLTVLDLSSYEDKNGNVVEFSRKLLPVKLSQQKKFMRALDSHDGSLRGLVVTFTRDGQMDAAIGNDIEFGERASEEELMEDYWREWTDRENKHHEENCGEPYVYTEIFVELSAEELADLAGSDPVPGSRAQTDRDLGESSRGRGAANRQAGRTGRTSGTAPNRSNTPQRSAGRAGTRPQRQTDDNWTDDNDQVPWSDDEHDSAAARPRRTTEPRGAAPASAPRTRRQQDAEADTAPSPDSRVVRVRRSMEPAQPSGRTARTSRGR